jgi:hypothetical protein
LVWLGRSVYGGNTDEHDSFSVPSSGPPYFLYYLEAFDTWQISQAVGGDPGPNWNLASVPNGTYMAAGGGAAGQGDVSGCEGV